MSLSSADIY